jgi:hypothetical protein
MPTSREYDELLDSLASTGPEAAALIQEFRAKHDRRRPSIPDFKYRCLARMYADFEKRFESQLKSGTRFKPDVRREFLRKFVKPIAKLGLRVGRKRDPESNLTHSLRKAVGRGRKEQARVRLVRSSNWRVVPGLLSLADIERERRTQLTTDYNMYLYLRAAQRWALLDASG